MMLHPQEAVIPEGTLQIAGSPEVPVPADFLGLTFPSSVLDDADFFVPQNVSLVQSIRALAPRGVLRIAGGATEVKSVDTDVIGDLNTFLKAIGWTCIYGLRTEGDVTATCKFLLNALGPRLHSFELSREDQESAAQRLSAARAVQAVLPSAPFSIADHAEALPRWAAEGASPQLRAVSLRLNPNAAADAAVLLAPTETAHDAAAVVKPVANALHAATVRVAECGLDGNSTAADTFASALWAAERCLALMQQGFAGIGMQSAVTSSTDRLVLSPIGMGMKFVAPFAGATMLPASLHVSGTRVAAYAARRADGRILVAVFNMERSAEVRITAPFFDTLQVLKAPNLDAHEAHVSSIVSETGSRRTSAGQSFTLPPHMATLIALR